MEVICPNKHSMLLYLSSISRCHWIEIAGGKWHIHTSPTVISAFLLEVSKGTKLVCSSARQAQNWPRWCCLDIMALESCDKTESENLSMDKDDLSVSQSLVWTCLARIREVRAGFDPHRDMRQLLWGNILCLMGLNVLKVFFQYVLEWWHQCEHFCLHLMISDCSTFNT